MIVSKELYEIKGSKLLVYPYDIENDINEKLGLNVFFETYSNGMLNMSFYFFDNVSFKSARQVKKYFLDNIPHCTNVIIQKAYITVQLTRRFGLDVLYCNEF